MRSITYAEHSIRRQEREWRAADECAVRETSELVRHALRSRDQHTLSEEETIIDTNRIYACEHAHADMHACKHAHASGRPSALAPRESHQRPSRDPPGATCHRIAACALFLFMAHPLQPFAQSASSISISESLMRMHVCM
jgi:hypothetical protein